MAKAAKVEFVCTECGMNYQRWQGQCRCGAWNTLAEFKPSAGHSKKASIRANVGGYAGGVGGGSKKINDIATSEAEKQLTEIGELDRVLSGGVTTG